MKTYNCPNCGAPINNEKCPYCGTAIIDFACIDVEKPFYMKIRKNGKVYRTLARLNYSELRMLDYSCEDIFVNDERMGGIVSRPNTELTLNFDVGLLEEEE